MSAQKPGQKGSPARRVAWEVLQAVYPSGKERTGKGPVERPLPALLDETARKCGLQPRDTALATELVYGVLRHESRLRRMLRSALKKPGDLPPALMLLLLLSTYELLFLDHIPPRATVHQAVGQARKRFGERMGGLVNGVLRSLDKNKERLQAEDSAFLASGGQGKSAEDVAMAGSWPLWLAELMVEQQGAGPAWELALASIAVPAATWRVNIRHPLHAAAVAELEELGAVRLDDWGLMGPKDLVLFREHVRALEEHGVVSRQGAGAIQASVLLAERIRDNPELSGKPLWDACCGRGGKSCALLERGAHVALCSDPSERRLGHVSEDIERLVLPVPDIVRGTVQDLARTRSFPVILLDVPCSGTGTLARNPELRLRLNLARMGELIELQASMLDAAWSALTPGGMLAYLTCSLDGRENEEQVARFVTRHPDCEKRESQRISVRVPGQDVLFAALLIKR